MKTNLAILISHGFSVIGIHLTPITGMNPVNTEYSCNHSTQLTSRFNALKAVTQLHLGGICEN